MRLSPKLERLARAASAELERLEREQQARADLDPVVWAHQNFVLPDTRRPIELRPHQQAVTRYALRRVKKDDPRIKTFPSLAGRVGRFPFASLIYSTPKKGGKTTWASIVGRFIAETQSRLGEAYCMGNDFRQATERHFKFIGDSLKETPGAKRKSGDDWVLPDRCQLHKTYIEFLQSGTILRPVSVDAPGEAGANPDVTLWTEIWAIILPAHVKFWVEMTPPPTKPDSMRVIDTYAGYEGESKVLEELYFLGKDGRQLTAGELAEATDTPLDAFEETQGDPKALVPIWVNEGARLFMYWDSGLVARRMPWQRGADAAAYYREEEKILPPNEYRRLHLNEWVGSESEFVPIAMWDMCREEHVKALQPGDRTPIVLAVDAGTTSDNFGIVAVCRCPLNPDDWVDVRAVRKWEPPPGGAIDYSQPEAFLRMLILGGCPMGHPLTPRRDALDERFSEKGEDGQFACPSCQQGVRIPAFNVVSAAFDSHQLVDMMQRLRRENIVYVKDFDQGALRLKADRSLYNMIVNREIHHDGNEAVREHIQNAKAKLQKDEDSKLRLVKKAQDRKIDLAVCLSMAAYWCRRQLL